MHYFQHTSLPRPGQAPSVFKRALALAAGFVLITAVTLPVGIRAVAHAQAVPVDSCRYFHETGHYVCDQFLQFFETRGGLETLGFPLSERHNDPAHGGLLVQYFQNARMEWHPDNPEPYQVQLGLLIDELGYRYPPARAEDIPPPDDPAHHYFPETGHVVSYAFLDAFHEKGGLDIFGYPRSEFLFEEGKVVQYFQRARMVWYRNEPGQPVRLSHVGEWYIEIFPVQKQYFRRASVSNGPRLPQWPTTMFMPLVLTNAEPRMLPLAGEPPPPTPTPPPAAPPTTEPRAPVTSLRLSASVRYPISGRTGTQTVFVYVTDQEGRPIEGAAVQVVVRYHWGEQACEAPPTDAAGFARCGFEILSPTPGSAVIIDVEVTFGGLRETTQTSFTSWW
jgi:hypothetical protein